MSRNQPLIAAAILVALSHTACDWAESPGTSKLAGTVTLVNRVSGEVRCVKEPNCEATLQTALRQRLNSAAIKMRPERQAVDVEFEQPATAFSSASFRQAVAEGGGEVLEISIEACGVVDTAERQSWITSGSTRMLLDAPGPFTTGTEICVTGELRDQVTPPRLVVPGKLLRP